jgi:hypothetical protein
MQRTERKPRLLAAALLLALTGPPPVSVDVSPRFSMGRGAVRLTARVAPHADNRVLRFVVDGPQYGAQDVPLEGLDAARISERWFKDVPPGDYEARAELYRGTSGRPSAVARARFCKSGPGVECSQ